MIFVNEYHIKKTKLRVSTEVHAATMTVKAAFMSVNIERELNEGGRRVQLVKMLFLNVF